MLVEGGLPNDSFIDVAVVRQIDSPDQVVT
jgi:hypothetical protein